VPVALDLFSGLGGWAEGLLAAGWQVIGMELDPRFIGRYPSEMIVQDVLKFSGHRARGIVDLVVASPPCTEPSYRAMPWKRAKALNAAGPPTKFIELFEACFRIADEISCPVIVENVKGAQPWVGRAKWHYGSFYLWGDVPALMPPPHRCGAKIPGQNWSRFSETGEVSPHWRMQVEGTKSADPDYGTRGWFGQHGGTNVYRDENGYGVKQHGSGPVWHSSRSAARREASAQIAKIPFDLAYHIGQVFMEDLCSRQSANF